MTEQSGAAMTPAKAIQGIGKRDEPLFDEDEVQIIFDRLAAAGYAIVPIKPNDEMIEELRRIGDGPMISGEECWGYMLAATMAHPTPDGEDAANRGKEG